MKLDILGGIAKLDYFWELFLNILRFFLRVRYRFGIFLGEPNFQLFLGVCLILLINSTC